MVECELAFQKADELKFWYPLLTTLSWGFGEGLDGGLYLHQGLNPCVDSKREEII